MYKSVIPALLISFTSLFAQTWTNTFTLLLSSKGGNTNVYSYAIAVNSTTQGDITIFNNTIKDSEFSFAVAQARSEYKGTQIENNGRLNLIFDYHANQTFSPFLFTAWEYDSLAGLDRRMNMGLGAKMRITTVFSVSLAGLLEYEKYTGQNSTNQARLSLRPKYKRSFDSGISVQWFLFYQPRVNEFSNYLLNQALNLSLKTRLDWLEITLTVFDNYNSAPPPGVKKEDWDIHLGFTINI